MTLLLQQLRWQKRFALRVLFLHVDTAGLVQQPTFFTMIISPCCCEFSTRWLHSEDGLCTAHVQSSWMASKPPWLEEPTYIDTREAILQCRGSRSNSPFSTPSERYHEILSRYISRVSIDIWLCHKRIEGTDLSHRSPQDNAYTRKSCRVLLPQFLRSSTSTT